MQSDVCTGWGMAAAIELSPVRGAGPAHSLGSGACARGGMKARVGEIPSVCSRSTTSAAASPLGYSMTYAPLPW
eukprot:10919626-Alexandrium_andersonii.AAC.1